MNISLSIKNLVSDTAIFLNQPIVKEGIKNVAGMATFGFGLVEICDIYQNGLFSSNWVITCAKISLLLSAAVSRPGVLIISTIAGSVFSPDQLRIFGPNTIFAVNPWHPRHIASIAAVVFALPSLFLPAHDWSSRKIQLMALFNTMTSRPVLHLGNQLVH